jgi:hypothetical protein
MSPLPMLSLNTRIGGSDSTPTTAFAGPRRCRFRTTGDTKVGAGSGTRAITKGGLASLTAGVALIANLETRRVVGRPATVADRLGVVL